jgi:5'-3' exonuclease
VVCCRRLFKEPEVTPADQVELKWEKPDEEGLIKFMVEEKGFSEERIRNGAKKLLKGREGNTQGRLDSFFKVRLHLLPNSVLWIRIILVTWIRIRIK